ncbi:hypothetical protein PUG81_29300 [Erwiniaceae bacterium L1_54_6]|nr:hypothetical protein [Erwiniaceae bacterium L1_54_6]
MRTASNVYLCAKRFLPDYDGGVWDFALTESGYGFMKPADDERCRMTAV